MEAQSGKFDPSKGSFNFAVPDVKTLLRHQKHKDKIMLPGIISSSFDLVDKMKPFILEYDAKRIASGLAPNKIGDVNLWGYKGPPYLSEAENKFKEEINIIEQLLFKNTNRKYIQKNRKEKI